MNKDKTVIIMYGPTGVGKTICADYLSSYMPVELVNADMGQFYVPLTIGTAKPNWRASFVPHHLFDSIAQPVSYSVYAYRARVQAIVQETWARNKIPLIVGGSSFYIASLFFAVPPVADVATDTTILPSLHAVSNEDLWRQLSSIDPERARSINPADRYRIERALSIWHATGIKPSQCAPRYEPIAPYHLMWLTREREELHQRIDERVIAMMQAGWIDEVAALSGTAWESFVRKKKIIGYADILEYLAHNQSYDAMIQSIQQRTKQYAKRQKTFWNSLVQRLERELVKDAVNGRCQAKVNTVTLTNSPIEGYSERLKKMIGYLSTY